MKAFAHSMRTACAIGAVVALLNVADATQAPTPDDASPREWRFRVTLDGRAIGEHRFALRQHGAERELDSDARFAVKFWFINAYNYAHSARERWRDNCLLELKADTDDNGEQIAVRGALDTSGFVVSRKDRTLTLDPCVQTFAYWNSSILKAERLLNPQTGEYLPIDIVPIGRETLRVGQADVMANRFRITGTSSDGEKLRIDLWYSENGHWLALESVAAEGRRLRYHLM